MLAANVATFERAGADEVLVVAGPGVDPSATGALPGHVRVIRSERDSFPRLARLGLEASRGELVAFTESHCSAESGWADRMRQSFEAGCAVVGGGVAAAPGLEIRNRALYAVDYGPFAAAGARDAHVLPGVNIAFRRSALAGIDTVPSPEFWKSFASWEVERRGGRLRFDPAPRVTYHRRLPFGEITSRRWHHGRCFGAMRAGTMPLRARAVYALAAPAIPFLLAARTFRTVLRYAGAAEAMLLLPAVFWIHLVWVAGEWVGHMAGAGESCDRL